MSDTPNTDALHTLLIEEHDPIMKYARMFAHARTLERQALRPEGREPKLEVAGVFVRMGGRLSEAVTREDEENGEFLYRVVPNK